MSRLQSVTGNRFEDLLSAAPGALDADTAMYDRLKAGMSSRLYALIGVTVASELGLNAFLDAVKGGLDRATVEAVAKDWRTAELNDAEKAVLAYAQKGTLDEGSVRKKDVDALREAGWSDVDVLTIATAIAYHNYALRLAAAFGVSPRKE